MIAWLPFTKADLVIKWELPDNDSSLHKTSDISWLICTDIQSTFFLIEHRFNKLAVETCSVKECFYDYANLNTTIKVIKLAFRYLCYISLTVAGIFVAASIQEFLQVVTTCKEMKSNELKWTCIWWVIKINVLYIAKYWIENTLNILQYSMFRK